MDIGIFAKRQSPGKTLESSGKRESRQGSVKDYSE